MFTSSLRPGDLLDKYTTVWTARETASLKTTPTNPNQPAILPPLFNVLAPLFNSARSIQINQYDGQKESGYEWLFNYKAVLNTKVQTITTKLSNALNSDLESIFSAYPGDSASYKNPDTDQTTIEPQPSADEWAWLYGANRTTWNVAPRRTGAPNSGIEPDWAGKEGAPDDGDLVEVVPNFPTSGVTTTFRPMVINPSGRIGTFATAGTQVIQSGGTVQAAATGTVRFHDGITAVSGVPASERRTSKFWAAYSELFNNPEFGDVWRYGLLDKVVITGQAAAGNGSQLQSSITLRMPDILKMAYTSAADDVAEYGTDLTAGGVSGNLKPGDPYPGQSNLPSPSPLSLFRPYFGGGSVVNNDNNYNQNYPRSTSSDPDSYQRTRASLAHGFIQNKFTAFWHS